MELLIGFLIIPVIAGLFARYYLKSTYTWAEFGISVAVTGAICALVFVLGMYNTMMDTEILNGEIVSKERVHGTYEESYQCNCRTVTHGSGDSEYTTTECQTCWRTHYTVTWSAQSTVGQIRFDHKDSTSRSVYNSPDPQAYVDCYVGEPASLPNIYINYIKAVPDSLFNTAVASQVYIDRVPSYPQVHSFYKVNRVIDNTNGALNSEFVTSLDAYLDDRLRVLGPAKQANIIVILTDLVDPSYRHAVENTWIGGKKNDVVVLLGTNGTDIIWADVMTWALNSGNEMLVAELKSKLLQIDHLDPKVLSNVISNSVDGFYTRPKMEDYEYLKSDIKPSTTLLLICWILNIILVIATTWFFHKNDFGGRRYRY